MEEMEEDGIFRVESAVSEVETTETFRDTASLLCSAGGLMIDQNVVDERTVFGRRESINRTPPKSKVGSNYERNRQNDKPVKISPKGARNRAYSVDSKRKFEEVENEGGSATTSLLESLIGTSEELLKRVEDQQWSKRVIKGLAQSLYRDIKDLEIKFKQMEATIRARKVPKRITEVREAGVQCTENDRARERRERAAYIRSRIDAGPSRREAVELLGEEWPEEVLSKTAIKMDKDAKYLEGRNWLVITEPGMIPSGRYQKDVEGRFRHFREAVKSSKGEVDFIVNETVLRTRKGGEEGKIVETAFVVPVNTMTECERETTESLYDNMVDAASLPEMDSISELWILNMTAISEIRIRKATELAFRGRNLVMALHREAKKEAAQVAVKSRGVEIVEVRAEGRSYADLLRQVKGKVDVQAVGVTVNKIRKTERGDLQLTVQGRAEKVRSLKEAIGKDEDWKVVTRRKGTVSIFVRGIDPTYTGAEALKELASRFEIPFEELALKAERKGRYGDFSIEVEGPKGMLERAIKVGKVRLGWTDCDVREKVAVARCYNCFEVGHFSKDCTAERSTKDTCLNCGKKGHKGKDCPNPPHCVKCQVDGHRLDQTRCPFFREELKKVRDSRRGKGPVA